MRELAHDKRKSPGVPDQFRIQVTAEAPWRSPIATILSTSSARRLRTATIMATFGEIPDDFAESLLDG